MLEKELKWRGVAAGDVTLFLYQYLPYLYLQYYKSRIYSIHYMVVSWNGGTPKSSILMACSIVNHLFRGAPIYGNPHIAATTAIFPLFTYHIPALDQGLPPPIRRRTWWPRQWATPWRATGATGPDTSQVGAGEPGGSWWWNGGWIGGRHSGLVEILSHKHPLTNKLVVMKVNGEW